MSEHKIVRGLKDAIQHAREQRHKEDKMEDHKYFSSARIAALKAQMDQLTDDERMELFALYCTHCGRDDPTCQCWNDE